MKKLYKVVNGKIIFTKTGRNKVYKAILIQFNINTSRIGNGITGLCILTRDVVTNITHEYMPHFYLTEKTNLDELTHYKPGNIARSNWFVNDTERRVCLEHCIKLTNRKQRKHDTNN